MVLQLITIGYLLSYIFNSNTSTIILFSLLFMIIMASWIALRIIKKKRFNLFKYAFVAIVFGGEKCFIYCHSTDITIRSMVYTSFYPSYSRYDISAMNCVSLASERIQAEINRGINYKDAEKTAFNASLIHIINSLFAVGLVSLPGMMTGQILSGVSPLISVRYQIMVMCMIFSSGGLASFLFLVLTRFKT